MLEAERARDPEVELSWDWWRRQAELYGVTPNNIYSRAVSRGLYIPVSRRSERAVDQAVSSQPERREPPSTPPLATPPPRGATQVLTERLQAMADVAGMLGEMEARIGELEREKEASDARSREAGRALDRLGRVLGDAVETIAALKQLHHA